MRPRSSVRLGNIEVTHRCQKTTCYRWYDPDARVKHGETQELLVVVRRSVKDVLASGYNPHGKTRVYADPDQDAANIDCPHMAVSGPNDDAGGNQCGASTVIHPPLLGEERAECEQTGSKEARCDCVSDGHSATHTSTTRTVPPWSILARGRLGLQRSTSRQATPNGCLLDAQRRRARPRLQGSRGRVQMHRLQKRSSSSTYS